MTPETRSKVGKLTTGTGVALGVLGIAFSPAVMDKLSSEHVFWMLITAIILTALGESIIPAIKGLLPNRNKDNDKC